MPRVWTNGSGLALSAANLNSLETDIAAALAKEPAITPGSNTQFFRGDKTWQTLTSDLVGLGNVSNTTDAQKPVSTAQQAALDLKVTKSLMPLNVKDKGALGNGTADDTAAFQSAIDSVDAGGMVFVPPSVGSYKITASLNVNKPVTIFGWGGKITFTASGSSLFTVTSSDVKLQNLYATGTGIAGTRVDGSNAVTATGTLATPLLNVRIESCTFKGWADSGIWLQYVTRAQVLNNEIVDVLYAGIMGLTAVDSNFNFNFVSNVVQKAPEVNSYGIALSDMDNTVAARSRVCNIIGNVIRDVPDWEGIDTHGGENITVVGNTVRRCKKGIALVAGSSTRVTAPTACVVTGNTIDCGTIPSPEVGIFLAGVDATTVASATITGNTITGYGAVSPITRMFIDATKTVVGHNAGADNKQPFSTATGTVTLGAVTANGGIYTTSVTFPTGRFSSAPVVTTGADSTRLTTTASNVTSTGFTYSASNWTTANSSVSTAGSWIAVQQ